ncbi:dihydroorotase [Desulfomarina sp.]
MKEVIILRNGRVLDPGVSLDAVKDIWIRDGMIVNPGNGFPETAEIVDVSGCWVVPGLIDMHVHLRDPGEEYKETIESGCRAAAAGGFTGVACMPNTNPVNDNGSVTCYIREEAQKAGFAHVYPVGAISRGSRGDELAEYGEMKEAGAVAFTDDGLPVHDSQLMRRAMEYSLSHDSLIMSHAEEKSLSRGGCMNEGETATRLGLQGIPNAAESIMVYRDIVLAELTGARVHISHVSTAESIELIRRGKARGVRVTAESAPHYFMLTEEAVTGYDTHAKMNPPLRSRKDLEAVRHALADGTLDAIATDHAPHSVLEKDVEFNYAANGIVGLETALSLGLALVREEVITPLRLFELMSTNPAGILAVPGGSLTVGSPADITVIDPDKKFVFDAQKSFSKSANSPFSGWELQGRAVLTLLGGRVTHRETLGQ